MPRRLRPAAPGRCRLQRGRGARRAGGAAREARGTRGGNSKPECVYGTRVLQGGRAAGARARGRRGRAPRGARVGRRAPLSRRCRVGLGERLEEPKERWRARGEGVRTARRPACGGAPAGVAEPAAVAHSCSSALSAGAEEEARGAPAHSASRSASRSDATSPRSASAAACARDSAASVAHAHACCACGVFAARAHKHVSRRSSAAPRAPQRATGTLMPAYAAPHAPACASDWARYYGRGAPSLLMPAPCLARHARVRTRSRAGACAAPRAAGAPPPAQLGASCGRRGARPARCVCGREAAAARLPSGARKPLRVAPSGARRGRATAGSGAAARQPGWRVVGARRGRGGVARSSARVGQSGQQKKANRHGRV
jgi:hypothetical protein